MRRRTADDGDSDRPPGAERFRALYERHVREVTAYCTRRVSPDRVDDSVAEIFLVAWRRIADVPAGAEARLWLFGVAHRVVGKEWRSDARRDRLGRRLRSLRPASAPTPEDAVLAGDDRERVLTAAARLNASDTEILRLLAWERLSAIEIARVLDIAPNAVHQRLHRAKRNLATELDRLDVTPKVLPALREGDAG